MCNITAVRETPHHPGAAADFPVEPFNHIVCADNGLRREKDKLERQSKKLLEAHYNDAIPISLMKSEQQKIGKQIAAIEREIKANEYTFDIIQKRLKDALNLIEDCGKTYRLANDRIKRMMNQAIFSKLWVESNGCVTAEFAEPFRTLVNAAQADIVYDRKEEFRGTTQARTDSLPFSYRLTVAVFRGHAKSHLTPRKPLYFQRFQRLQPQSPDILINLPIPRLGKKR